MDFTTIIGIGAGIFLVVQAIAMRGGNLPHFYNLPSVFITFGGTFAAVLVNYPLKQIFNVFKIASKVVIVRVSNPTEIIEELISYARLAREKGGLALQEYGKYIKNDFLRRGIQLIIDGATRDQIETELNTEITFMQRRHRAGQEVFITLGTYAPAFGMIGTVIGLILMLLNIQDQSQIASGMAVALLTTFYGLLAGYLIFLPIAGKLKRRSDEEAFIKQVVIQGILSIQTGDSTFVMEDKLKAYLEPALRERIKRKKIKLPEKKAELKKPGLTKPEVKKPEIKKPEEKKPGGEKPAAL